MLDEREKLLALRQISERLTLSQTSTLKRLTARKIPGAFKIGRAWRIKSSDLEAYIDRLRGESLTATLNQQVSQSDFEQMVKRANEAGWKDLDAIIAEEIPEAA